MVSPNRRTWTLAELDRGTPWRLWFCERERRWEVEPEVERADGREAAGGKRSAPGDSRPAAPWPPGWPAPD